MEFLVKLNRLLNQILMILGGIALLRMMILATKNVVLRIFKMPYDGAYEITGFLGALVIAFALGYTQRRKDHIVVDIVSRRFPPRVARILDIIKYSIEIIFFSIISWQVFALALKYREEGEVSETLKIKFYPYVICVGIGFACLALNLLTDLLTTMFIHKEGKKA